jgi:hypothetical protein
VKSTVAAVAQMRAGPIVLVWAVGETDRGPAVEALTAFARSVAATRLPFVFVAFDPRVDSDGNARQVADRLGGREISCVVVLDALQGAALRFQSANGDLIPAFDLYAEMAEAPHQLTRATLAPDANDWPGIRPFIEHRSIVITGTGGAGDLRADASATLGYLAGRLALDAEELR